MHNSSSYLIGTALAVLASDWPPAAEAAAARKRGRRRAVLNLRCSPHILICTGTVIARPASIIRTRGVGWCGSGRESEGGGS